MAQNNRNVLSHSSGDWKLEISVFVAHAAFKDAREVSAPWLTLSFPWPQASLTCWCLTAILHLHVTFSLHLHITFPCVRLSVSVSKFPLFVQIPAVLE